MLADEEVGLARSDMANEMQHAQPAGLEQVGVCLDHRGQLVTPGMFEHADRHHLVVPGIGLAEVGLAHAELVVQAAGA